MTADPVFLLDVDNPPLDREHIVRDQHDRIACAFGVAGEQRYWAIFEAMREAQGYVDYLGALQRDRLVIEAASAIVRRLQMISSVLIDCPFADRLYPLALEAIAPLRRFGTTVLLTDGDVVLQPRKLQRSGLWDPVDGRVLSYIHKKKLDAVQHHYPARQDVIVDDRPRVLAAMKAVSGERLSTVFPRQGHYAHDAAALAAKPPAGFTGAHIGKLVERDFSPLLVQRPSHPANATLKTP